MDPAKQQIKNLDSYIFDLNELPVKIDIVKNSQEFVTEYLCYIKQIEGNTELLLQDIKHRLIREVEITMEEVVNPKEYTNLKSRYRTKAQELITKEFQHASKETKDILLNHLMIHMLGLGDIEYLLADDNLEEIVINNATVPAWVYHKVHGWLRTNISIKDDAQIQQFATIIGRNVGKEITNLTPLMDASLLTGDRVNATLFPISTDGNTITIRKFARKPWSVIDFIHPDIKTLSPEIGAMLWLAVQYELNILVSGGTGSGKTSMLNAITPFIPADQRIISIEDTRELQVPKFLHYISLLTRSPNPEGKGEVSMLDLMVNSLRMRPDRIFVGEIRRSKEAEVLFEAMHTGHSVYATLHADNAMQTYRRLINPPINIPKEMLGSLHLILVQFRQRRLKIRRTYELAEIYIPKDVANPEIELNILYKWNAKTDTMVKVNPSKRIVEEMENRTGMTPEEIQEDLLKKEKILSWMLEHGVSDINDVGWIISSYYEDEDKINQMVQDNVDPRTILRKK